MRETRMTMPKAAPSRRLQASDTPQAGLAPRAGSRPAIPDPLPRRGDASKLAAPPAGETASLTSLVRARLAVLSVVWRRLSMGPSLAVTLRAQLSLERGERALSACCHPSDGYALVATDRALYLRGADDRWSRHGWEEVARVSWDHAARRLTVVGLCGGSPVQAIVALRDHGTILELALERITHTRLGQWSLPLPGGEHILVDIRRQPGTGRLTWSVRHSGSESGRAARPDVERALASLAWDLGVSPPQSLA